DWRRISNAEASADDGLSTPVSYMPNDNRATIEKSLRSGTCIALSPNPIVGAKRSVMATTYDAIIVGTGQAGPPLAQRLTGAGKKVAIIERKLFGGTCVNT